MTRRVEWLVLDALCSCRLPMACVRDKRKKRQLDLARRVMVVWKFAGEGGTRNHYRECGRLSSRKTWVCLIRWPESALRKRKMDLYLKNASITGWSPDRLQKKPVTANRPYVDNGVQR